MLICYLSGKIYIHATDRRVGHLQSTVLQTGTLVRTAPGHHQLVIIMENQNFVIFARLRRWCMNRRLEAIRGPGPVGARWATISA